MDRELYIEIWSLLNDQVKKAEDSVEHLLELIDEAEDISDCGVKHAFNRIKKDRAIAKKYRALLERFEAEVKEPEA